MLANIKWFIENLGNIMLLLVLFLSVLGVVVEAIARLIPTKTPDSALTRIGLFFGNIGSSLVVAGKFVQVLLDFIKFPNNRKK